MMNQVGDEYLVLVNRALGISHGISNEIINHDERRADFNLGAIGCAGISQHASLNAASLSFGGHIQHCFSSIFIGKTSRVQIL